MSAWPARERGSGFQAFALEGGTMFSDMHDERDWLVREHMRGSTSAVSKDPATNKEVAAIVAARRAEAFAMVERELRAAEVGAVAMHGGSWVCTDKDGRIWRRDSLGELMTELGR